MNTDLALTPAASAAAAGAVMRAEVRTLVVTGPDIQTLLDAVSLEMEVVPSMEIDSDDMAAEMLTSLGRLSTVESAIEAEREERKRPLLETGRWLDSGYTPTRDSIKAIIAAGKNKLTAWGVVKREAARKLEAEAAEKRRLEAEAAAKIEADAIAAANATAAQAVVLRAAGSEQVADAMETQAMVQVDTARQNAAVAVQAMHVAPLRTFTAPVKGASKRWKGECTDKAKLLQHVGELIAKGDRSLMNLFEIDPKAINALAKLQEANLNIPGLRAYTEDGVAIRKVAVAA